MKTIFPHKKCAFLQVGNGQYPETSEMDAVVRDISFSLEVPLVALALSHDFSADLGIAFAALAHLVKQQDRRFILLTGAYLEDQISFCALRGLVEGFDIHLLADAVRPHDRRLAQVHLMRLLQAGVVPTTLLQTLYFWSVETVDPIERERIKAFIDRLTS